MSDSSPAAGQLRIDLQYRKNAMIVKLVGSANMESADTLRDQLLELVDQSKEIILDLSELEFISSVGLGGIIAAHIRCQTTEGVVKLVAPKSAIRQLLEVTQLAQLFTIHDSVEAALAKG